MPKYAPFVRQYAKWLYQFVDRHDWGRFIPKLGHPMPVLSRDEFLSRKNSPPWVWKHPFMNVPKLTMTRITEHLDHQKVIYYRSHRKAARWLLNIDIDAKTDGQVESGAEAAAEYIARTLHKDLYYEPSTGGKGRHVYLVVERGWLSYDRWKALLERYIRALQIIMCHRKIKAGIDRICGMPTKLSSGADENCEHVWTIKEGDCGILSKVPMIPMGDLGLNHLVTSPVLKPEDFEKVIAKAEKLRSKVEKKLATSPEHRDRRQYDMLTRLGSRFRLNLDNVRSEPNAFRRMHFACTLFIMVHKRFAHNDLELAEYYEDNQFHSGMGSRDRKVRLKRAGCVLKFQMERCSEETAGVFGYDPTHYTKLVSEHVKSEHWDGVKRPADRPVADDDLAVCLYVMERNAMKKASTRRRQGTTGFQSIIDMSKVLRDSGVLRRASNPNQACAARKVLVNAGLATCEDDGYFAGGPQHGWCKKFGMGEKHPQRAAYVQFREKVIDDRMEQHPVTSMPMTEISESFWEEDQTHGWSESFNEEMPKINKPKRVVHRDRFELLWGPEEQVEHDLPVWLGPTGFDIS